VSQQPALLEALQHDQELLEENRYLTDQLQYAQEELARKEDELMMLREQLGHLMLERQAMITQREGASLQLDEKDGLIDRMLMDQQNKGAEEDKKRQELIDQA
jgi:hypothetical protein